jgi:Flp pilus assembly protein TadD
LKRLAAILGLLLLPVAALGGTREAAQRVREGIKHFKAGQYEQSAKAFAEADVARPDDPWIAFDRACAYAAQGDRDKAVERFEQAALSRDGCG